MVHFYSLLDAQPKVYLPMAFFLVGTFLIIFFLFFFYLFFIQMQRRRSIHQQEVLALKTRYEKTIMESQLEIQEQTFRNISQEIHDNIGQVLSLAKLNLNTVMAEQFSDKIQLTEELLGKAINDLRDISKSLNPEKIADIGLVNAIRNELQVISRAAKIRTEFICEEDDLGLKNETAIIIFRMIQEILNNIIRHARAKYVTVAIEKSAMQTLIEVRDDGSGFDVEKLKSTETGIGLKSIQQRCSLINAAFTIDSKTGEGTTIRIQLNNNN
ncbi:MAG TPA: ATP-binding protein [Panacibacter sp.]|nr:ATP-binding protein [Panacibacter sp.]HNP44710.1 ATP-binding protein [Panacibacter sp.]